VTGYMPRWFTRPQTVTHPSTNLAVHDRELNSQHNDYNLNTKPPMQYTAEVLFYCRVIVMSRYCEGWQNHTAPVVGISAWCDTSN